MLYEISIVLFILLCLLLIALVLVQKAKSSLGVDSLSSGAQMLFGGSGGQDIIQKITWTMGAMFIALSLTLAVIKKNSIATSKYKKEIIEQEEPASKLPAKETTESK